MRLTYRDDIREFNDDSEFKMTEAQFSDLELFVQEELKKVSAYSFKTEEAFMVSTKQFILLFRKRCQITEEVTNIIFAKDKDRRDSLATINFYNIVKLVVIRSSSNKKFNLKTFKMLLKELRVKLDILKKGLGPDKINQLIDFGLDRAEEDLVLCQVTDIDLETERIRQKRIENIVLQEFGTINISRVLDALLSSGD